MKKVIRLLLVTGFLLAAPMLFSQPSPADPLVGGGSSGGGGPIGGPAGGGAPIDGGLSILLLLGCAYGAKKVYVLRKEVKE
jgi:hypothetical protein